MKFVDDFKEIIELGAEAHQNGNWLSIITFWIFALITTALFVWIGVTLYLWFT